MAEILYGALLYSEMRDFSQELKSDQKAKRLTFHPMPMKSCMEVTFGGIQLKRNT